MRRRLFLGVSIPDAVRAEIGRLRETLKDEGIRARNWLSSDLYHITLVFLGEMSEDDTEPLMRAVEQVASHYPPITLTLSGMGAFRRNKILWLGLAMDAGWLALAKLQSDLVQGVTRVAPRQTVERLDTRPFAPHLTLARHTDLASLGPVAERGDILTLQSTLEEVSFDIQDICLFESTRREGNLVYPVTSRFALSK